MNSRHEEQRLDPDERAHLLSPLVHNEGHQSTTIPLFMGYVIVFIGAISQSLRMFSFHVAEYFLDFPVSTSVMLSGITYILFCLLYITFFQMWRSIKLSRIQFLRLSIRGFCSASNIYLTNFALSRIPVGNSLTIAALAPAITSLLATCFLNDSISCYDAMILIINLLGVTIVAHPSITSSTYEAWGVFAALMAALSSSIGFILVKIMGIKVHFILNTLSHGVNSLILSSIFITSTEIISVFHNGIHLGLVLILIGSVLGWFTQSLMNIGIQIVRPGPGLVVRSFNVPVTILLGALFLNESVTFILLIGVSFVLFSVCSIGVRQYLKDRADRS